MDRSLTLATGYAEREQALDMANRLPAGATLGADKTYDTCYFLDVLCGLAVTPRLAQNFTNRASAIDRRTTRHGYETSQQHCNRIEEIFGWLKTVGLMRNTAIAALPGPAGWTCTLGLTVCHPVRLRRLVVEPT